MSDYKELHAFVYPIIHDDVCISYHKFPDEVKEEDLVHVKISVLVSKDRIYTDEIGDKIYIYGERSDVEELIRRKIHDLIKHEEEDRK